MMKKLWASCVEPSSGPSVYRRSVRAMTSRRQCNSAGRAPVETYSDLDGSIFQAKVGGPLRGRFNNAVVFKHDIIPAIALLCFFVRPSNIARFVVAVYVYAIQRVFWCRFASDFIQKLLKRIKQEFNAAAAISCVGGVGRIITTSFCSLKTSQFWGRAFISRLTMRNGMKSLCFLLVTSTRTHISTFQTIRARKGNVSTVAKALPSNFTRRRSVADLLNGQSIEFATS